MGARQNLALSYNCSYFCDFNTSVQQNKKQKQKSRCSVLTCRLLLLLFSASTLFFPLPFPFLAKLSNPPSTRCTCRYLSLVLTENVLAVSCCLATRGIRLIACRKFLNVSRSSLICLPLVGTLTISLNRSGCTKDVTLEIGPEIRQKEQRYERLQKQVMMRFLRQFKRRS